MIVLGLTGSIGMGKSTTLRMFAEAGAAVWSADEAVHRLYAKDGAAVAPVEAAFPGVTAEGVVDRTRLAAALGDDADAFARLEAIVHPLVARDRADVRARTERDGADVLVVDIPLLFETGAEVQVDAVVVVTARPELQRRRVLARPGMTAERLSAILARQLSDAEKRLRADFLIDTGEGLDAARERAAGILKTVRDPLWTPPRSGQ